MMPSSLWISGLLIFVDLLAGLAVGVGIIFEGGEHNTPREKLGAKLVIWGVVFEALAGVALFGFDTSESLKQQAQIVSEARTIDDQAGKLRDAANVAGAAKSDAAVAITNAGIAKGKADAANMFAQGVSDKIGPLGDRIGAQSARLGALSAQEQALLERISSAQARLDNLAKEGAEFQDAISPRLLEQGAVAKALAPFADVPFFSMTKPLPFGDPEFAAYLQFGISMGGKPSSAFVQDDGRSLPQGIDIVSLSGVRARTAAAALCVALADQGLDVHTSALPAQIAGQLWPASVPQDAVLIRIGRKANNFFTNKMLAAKGLKPIPSSKELEEEVRRRLSHSGVPEVKYPFCS